MLFTNPEKDRGMLTSSERADIGQEVRDIGRDPKKIISSGDALMALALKEARAIEAERPGIEALVVQTLHNIADTPKQDA